MWYFSPTSAYHVCWVLDNHREHRRVGIQWNIPSVCFPSKLGIPRITPLPAMEGSDFFMPMTSKVAKTLEERAEKVCWGTMHLLDLTPAKPTAGYSSLEELAAFPAGV